MRPGSTLSLLDVGTGLGDIPAAIAAKARTRGATIRIIGLDEAWDLLRAARSTLNDRTQARATALPFRNASIDVVMCSQLLHHFDEDHLSNVVRELNRVARRRVIVADLRRSRIAAAGFWLASFPLRFHPVTRHDGVVSVFRGFLASELREVVQRAVGVTPAVRHHLGFRLTATWTPRGE